MNTSESYWVQSHKQRQAAVALHPSSKWMPNSKERNGLNLTLQQRQGANKWHSMSIISYFFFELSEFMLPKDMSDLCFTVIIPHDHWPSLLVCVTIWGQHVSEFSSKQPLPCHSLSRLTVTVPQVTSHCLRETHHDMLPVTNTSREIHWNLKKKKGAWINMHIASQMSSPLALLEREVSFSYHCWWCGCLHCLAGALPGYIPHPKSCRDQRRCASWEWLGSETVGHHHPHSPS